MFSADDLPRIRERWTRVLEAPAALYGYFQPPGSGRSAERLLLPVSDAADVPRFVFGLTLYHLGTEPCDASVAPTPEAAFYDVGSLAGEPGR
jgi:hypothetical protein